MRFTITDEAIKRLDLDPSVTGREFDGWSVKEGLLGGVPRGVLRWAKKQLKVDRIEDIDSADARLVYYLLAIKNDDHALLPFARIDELALTDFSLVKHEVLSLDQDGDCGECNQPLDSDVHLQPDTSVGEVAAKVRPTRAPGKRATTETETT